MTRPLSRRAALMLGAGGLCLPALKLRAQAPARPLPIPPLVEAGDAVIPLVLAAGTHDFGDGVAARTAGISADYLGPTIRLTRGRTARVQVRNRLDQPSTLHWHGLMAPATVDGAPHAPIAPGDDWSTELPVDQPPATLWFHPHPHQDSARQTYEGMAAMMIVTDGRDAERGLPVEYGVDDLPIILQDRRLGADGYAPDLMDLQHGFRGDAIVVNGALAPTAAVPAGLVRLRLLNAANASTFDVAFGDGRTFHVVASDGGYLAAPVAVDHLPIASGERYELLVDFTAGGAAQLVARAEVEGAHHQPPRTPILDFQPDPARSNGLRLPDRLDDPGPVDPAAAVGRRHFLLDEMNDANQPRLAAAGAPAGHGAHAGHGMAMPAGPDLLPATSGLVMGINGKPFALDRIDAEAAVGTTEIWTIEVGEMPHPFHLHGAQFRILSQDGQPPRPEEIGWKDVVLVRRTAELLVRFDQPATANRPFMFHCHILEHEDLGMMGQFTAA